MTARSQRNVDKYSNFQKNLMALIIIHFVAVGVRTMYVFVYMNRNEDDWRGLFFFYIVLHLGIAFPVLEVMPKVVPDKKSLIKAVAISQKIHSAVLSVCTGVMALVSVFALMHHYSRGATCLYEFSYEILSDQSEYHTWNDYDDPWGNGKGDPGWFNFVLFGFLFVFYGLGTVMVW